MATESKAAEYVLLEKHASIKSCLDKSRQAQYAAEAKLTQQENLLAEKESTRVALMQELQRETQEKHKMAESL